MCNELKTRVWQQVSHSFHPKSRITFHVIVSTGLYARDLNLITNHQSPQILHGCQLPGCDIARKNEERRKKVFSHASQNQTNQHDINNSGITTDSRLETVRVLIFTKNLLFAIQILPFTICVFYSFHSILRLVQAKTNSNTTRLNCGRSRRINPEIMRH